MLPRLLIVGHIPVPADLRSLRPLDAEARCQWSTFDDFRPEMIARSRAQLLLVHAAPVSDQTVSFFEWLKKSPIPIPTLAILPEVPAHGPLEHVWEIIDDFVLAPVRTEELDLRISKVLGVVENARRSVPRDLASELALAKLIGKNPAFRQAVELTQLFARNDAPVLISGETGTGKELFAHAIHSLSRRRNGPFIPVDCGTLPDHLAENELFGHSKGAFTDAYREQRGLAAMAEGGTLFLDEVDSLSLANQAKLLRFLEEGTFRALGADCFTRANVRIIAATNCCIEDHVQRRQFRSDLYFRLNVLRLKICPLRERAGDVSILARHFLENDCESSSERKVFTSAALRKLESHPWPGNVRELLNTVQRSFVCCPGRHILPEHILLAGRETEEPSSIPTGSFRSAKQNMIRNFEKSYLEELMAKHDGNITRAAREAGKDRRAMGRLIKKYGLGSQNG